jgi:uncharacterized repeat protein (TIGR03803 family)
MPSNTFAALNQALWSGTLRSIGAALLATSLVGPASAATFKVLHHFNPAHGGDPEGGLAIDALGNLYGTTSTGGKFGVGTVFKFAGGRFSTIHNFAGGADGATPLGRLLLDSHGDIYGTTLTGGAANAGTLFRLKGGSRYRVLASLDGAAEGNGFNGGVVEDADGTLYAGALGSVNHAGALLAFRPPQYQPSVLYTFTGFRSDGGPPESEPIIVSGRLMGTGFNTIYSIALDGSDFVNLSDPANWDQEEIYASLTPDGAGNFWGVMSAQYNQNEGEIYRIDPAGALTYKFNFTNDQGIYGVGPRGTLLLGVDGLLYGTTRAAGRSPNGTMADGTVFSYDPTSGVFTTVYAFPFDDSKGGAPFAGLVQDAAGSLYGVTTRGGKFDGGTLFRIDP